MEFLNIVLQKFEVAFQKHEKEVVIELAIDRILTFIGVHMMLGLAGLFKVAEVAGDTFNLFDENIACYPYKTNSTPQRPFMTHANKFCWESTGNFESQTSYGMIKFSNNLLQNAVAVKALYKLLPYLFIAEAALLSLPGAYWNISVGPRVTGLLKFMLHFLDDVYKSLKNIPAGLYRMLPYDKEGNYLDGWRRFKNRYKAEHQGMSNEKKEYGKKKQATVLNWKEPSEVIKKMVDQKFSDDDDSDSENETEKSSSKQDTSKPSCDSWWTRLVDACNNPHGDIKDRQVFSMLCYENFASLSYQPYIMAVEALTSTKSAEGHRRGIVPLKKGILAQLCHRDNFTGEFLARCYMKRYVISILLSSLLVLQSWIVFIVYFIPTFSTKVFPCFIPATSATVICVLNKHWDITALYLINALMLTAHCALSVYQFLFVRFGSKRGMCYFFEDIADSSSVALQSAAIAEKDMAKK